MSKIAGVLVLVILSAIVGAQWPKEAEAQLSTGLMSPYGDGEGWLLDPDRYVHIEGGTSYTVPDGLVLLVGAVGGDDTDLYINGALVWHAPSTGGAIHPGIVAREGDVVSVERHSHDFALGKLYVPAQ